MKPSYTGNVKWKYEQKVCEENMKEFMKGMLTIKSEWKGNRSCV